MGTNNEEEIEELEELEETDPADTGKSEESSTINKLRKELRAANKELKELRPVREVNAFLSAGLGNLSEDHKTALRAVVGSDLSTENLTTKAKALGFVSKESKTEDESKEIDKEVATISDTEKVVSTQTAKPDNRDFVTKVREAKTQDEVLALVASEGGEHGLIIDEQ